MDNILHFVWPIQANGEFRAPLSPSKKFSPIALVDVAQAYAAIIGNPRKHSKQSYSLYSDSVTYLDVEDELRSVTRSNKVSFVQMTPEEGVEAFKSYGSPDWEAKGIVELFGLAEEQDPSMVSSDTATLRGIIGRKPTSLKAWVALNQDTFKNIKVASGGN